MILAPSLRQPLSGNKLLLLLIVLLLAGMACSASKRVVYLEDRRVQDSIEVVKAGEDKQKQEEEIKQQKEAAMPEFDRDFHVALFLPFSLHKVPEPGDRDYKVLESVTDYYQGILLALEELKSEGIQLTLHVFDTRRDSLHMAGLLVKNNLKDMDLVIGPLDKELFKQVASRCVSLEIPLVAPFTLPDSTTAANAFAFYCAPAIEAYGMKVARYLLSQPSPGVILHLSDRSSTDRAFMRGFRAVPGSSKLVTLDVKIEEGKEYSRFLEVKKNEESKVNYVLIPTDNEKLANMALRSFTSAEEEEVPVQLFGLDTWMGFRDPELEHWEKLNATLVTAYFINPADSSYRSFYTRYRAMHQIAPSDFALKGYDQMIFFGNAIMAFGKYFPAYITGTDFRGTGSDFYWTKGARVVENRGLRLIHFNDYHFSILP